MEEWLYKNKIKTIKNFKISSRSWLKAGGVIKNFITPKNQEDCIKVIKYFIDHKIDFYILGNISNTIIRDGIIHTPIINLNELSKIHEEKIENGYKLKVSAGTSLPKFAKYMTKNGVTGCEGLVGIPGKVGGGVVMNCSSYGSCISDYLLSLDYLDDFGNKINIKKDECKFSFRNSLFLKKKYLILDINFFFPKENYIGKEKTDIKMKKIIDHRINFQEKLLPNLGSLFATKDLYKNLKKKILCFFFIYCLHKITSIIIYKFCKKKILNYRKIIVKIYKKLLKLDTTKKYSLSDTTINCIVNKGSVNADDAIDFVKNMKKKIGNFADLEIIILENIK